MSALRKYVYRENQLAPISGQTAKVLRFIKSSPTFPSSEEIRVHMGWKKYASVSDVMRLLVGAGYVRRTENFGRPNSRDRWELI
jgi:hypothetical protein